MNRMNPTKNFVLIHRKHLKYLNYQKMQNYLQSLKKHLNQMNLRFH